MRDTAGRHLTCASSRAGHTLQARPDAVDARPLIRRTLDLSMNRNSYNKIAHAWGSARSGFFGREREYLDAVLSVVPKGSTILDLGCGTGRPMAEYVISRGHHVVGVDQSEKMLGIARRYFPHETWVLSPMETYDPQVDDQGALIWDALFHVRRTDWVAA